MATTPPNRKVWESLTIWNRARESWHDYRIADIADRRAYRHRVADCIRVACNVPGLFHGHSRAGYYRGAAHGYSARFLPAPCRAVLRPYRDDHGARWYRRTSD